MTRYELLDRIGVGGMAEIFRGKAVAAGGFEKPVAIKRILPHLSQDKRFVELLIAEAKVLSLLKHRNIVQIFDVGLGDDGQYFLVMEYVDGKDVGAIQRALETRRRRMPFDLALHIGAEICEALEHAHTARAPDGKPMALVHRDVSPSNVLISRAGEIKLTDFGIAKRAESEHTGSGAVRGKFAYISPEQARNEHLDPRSDVFSVAVLVWELVTNQRLFSGLGDLEALRAVREAAVRRPTEVDPRLPPELDDLLLAALSRDPRNRPTAGQLGAQLQSMRYSLEVTVGDPATELARIIDTAEQVIRETQQLDISSLRNPFDGAEHEHTVIQIRTADAFTRRDKDGLGISAARKVIHRFEEEETRLAQLSSDQLRMLRARRDTADLTPPPRTDARSRRPTDEPTTARAPLHASFDPEEATRLLAPPNRRTPAPERVRSVEPAPLPGVTHPRTVPRAPARLDDEVPGTVHNRNPNPAAPHLPQPQEPPAPSAAASEATELAPPPIAALAPAPLVTPAPVQPTPSMGAPPFPPHPPLAYPPAGPGAYPAWGNVQPQLPGRAASPTAQELYDRQVPYRPSSPHVAGFGPARRPALQPWMLVVGALLMAAIAFAITRALIG